MSEEDSVGERWLKTIEPGVKVIVYPADTWRDERKQEVRIFGIGEYLGNFMPPECLDTGGEGIILDFEEGDDGELELEKIRTDGEKDPAYSEELLKQPKIRLIHSGEEVWGIECWWKPLVLDGVNELEELISKGISVHIIDIKAIRAEEFRINNPEVSN